MATFRPSLPIRISAISGYNKRFNDVIYCHPVVRNKEEIAVIYFGGDIQDYTENMQQQKEKTYLKWNLIDTGRILQSSFLDCHVIVIRPTRMEHKVFSCFENFVPCVNYGSPKHTFNHFALVHLEKLLQNVSQYIRNMSLTEVKNAFLSSQTSLVCKETLSGKMHSSNNSDDTCIVDLSTDSNFELNPQDMWWQNDLNLCACKINLVGFSKGCVVLNQFLYEFYHYKTLSENSTINIIERISDMYWLDGGHSGGKNTWITYKPILQVLSTLGIKVHIHVTPYQIEDKCRPWIKEEEQAFFDNLRQLNVFVNRTTHFVEVERNLNSHFNVLSVFRQN